MPNGKVDPEAIEFNQIKDQFVVIEEKVDGTGVSICLDNHYDLRIRHRGNPAIGKEFKALHDWATKHWDDLLDLLGERYVLCGEWMYSKHTIFYDKLPHHFLESDIYDKERKIWLSTSARSNLLLGADFIKQVPVLAALKPTNLKQITGLLGKTAYQTPTWQQTLQTKAKMFNCPLDKVMHETDQSGLMEGLYIKQEDDLQVVGRYKYIRYDFLQSILNSGTHLIDRLPVYNNLEGEVFSFHAGE